MSRLLSKVLIAFLFAVLLPASIVMGWEDKSATESSGEFTAVGKLQKTWNKSKNRREFILVDELDGTKYSVFSAEGVEPDPDPVAELLAATPSAYPR